MTAARALPPPLISLPMPTLRLLASGREETSVDFEEARRLNEEYAAYLEAELQDEAHWQRVADESLNASAKEAVTSRQMAQGSAELLRAFNAALPPRKDEPAVLQEKISAAVRAAIRMVEQLHRKHLLLLGLHGIYEGLPADLAERAHRLRWLASKARASTEEPAALTPEGVSLFAELDALMLKQSAGEIATTMASAAEEQQRRAAFLLVGGDPEAYDPSQA